jgi:hypothetical protein
LEGHAGFLDDASSHTFAKMFVQGNIRRKTQQMSLSLCELHAKTRMSLREQKTMNPKATAAQNVRWIKRL